MWKLCRGCTKRIQRIHRECIEIAHRDALESCAAECVENTSRSVLESVWRVCRGIEGGLLRSVLEGM